MDYSRGSGWGKGCRNKENTIHLSVGDQKNKQHTERNRTFKKGSLVMAS